MAEWTVSKRIIEYLGSEHDTYPVPGKVTFIADDGRVLDSEEIPMALERLDNLSWVNELHLPPEGLKVFATDGEHIATAQHGGKYQGLDWTGWVTIDPIKGLLVGQDITHWMRVPELPEGD